MKLQKYKIKLSIFITFIVFFVIFLTWLSFILFENYKYKKLSYKKLKNTELILKNIKKKKLENIINNKRILRHLHIKYIQISKNNKVLFSNFNEEYCSNEFICHDIKRWNYKIKLAYIKPQNNLNENIANFALFAFLISLFLYFPIYLLIEKINKPIEENFEFMKNFVNNAWHELKTPIANINIASQLILQNRKYDEELIKDIFNESSNMIKLIDTLLEISTINNFKNKEKIYIKQDLENIVNSFQKQINDKNLDIEKNIEDFSIYTNKQQFHILIRNLISNAIKYNFPKGKIKIEATNNKIVISNTWKKINNEEKEKIFNLFYRVENIGEWYGLGLALVKKIIDLNNWKIKIQSDWKFNIFTIMF